jgi:hypothetical protein
VETTKSLLQCIEFQKHTKFYHRTGTKSAVNYREAGNWHLGVFASVIIPLKVNNLHSLAAPIILIAHDTVEFLKFAMCGLNKTVAKTPVVACREQL